MYFLKGNNLFLLALTQQNIDIFTSFLSWQYKGVQNFSIFFLDIAPDITP